MDLPVIVISLVSALERRERIRQQMEAHNIPFEFLDATDANSALTHPFAECAVGPRFVRLRSGLVVGNTELACAISHYRALERIVSAGSLGGIIIEDDAVLRPTFKDFRTQIFSAGADWANRRLIVHCAENFAGDGAGLVLGQHSSVNLACGVSLLRVRRFSNPLWGTVGYFATVAAARSLLRRDPDRADAWQWFLADGTLDEIWLARPEPLIHPPISKENPSQIAADREALHGSRPTLLRRLQIRSMRLLFKLLQLVAQWTIDPIIRRLG